MGKLNHIQAKRIRKYIEEELHLWFMQESLPICDNSKYLTENYDRSRLNEMARLNTDEMYGYFPYNKFDVSVFPNDHEPAHFHVIHDGWNIRVSIDTGEILSVKSVGKNSQVYTYVKKCARKWLKKENSQNIKKTNQEIAFQEWEENQKDNKPNNKRKPVKINENTLKHIIADEIYEVYGRKLFLDTLPPLPDIQ